MRFSQAAFDAAESIANYCETRFPSDHPPSPVLDVPWFAEKVQNSIDAVANERAEWWMGVAEAKQEERDKAAAERDRLKAGLEMLAQIRHVSGSAQAAFRSNLRTIDAILAGADVRDLATVEAIAAGEPRA